MTLTRALMERLREHLGESDPLPQPPPIPVIPPPPARVFPSLHTRSRFAAEAAEHTTALVGIGHVGSRYGTDVVLQFQAELAVAHEAVSAVLPEGWAETQGLLPLRTRARTHQEFLLRPDLGRRLEDSSRKLLRDRAAKGIDIQPILADGLSAVACMGSGMELLEHMTKACAARGWSVGTPMCAQFARVWLEDDIGEEVRTKVAIIGMDAALKAAEVRLAKVFTPPTETNFAAAWLTGDLDACQAAATAFAEAIVQVARHPIEARFE